jgi:hypothetical protein
MLQDGAREAEVTKETGGAEAEVPEHDVFLSCSQQDRVLGAAARRALEKVGISAWLHSDTSTVEEAIAALSRARLLVLVFSEHANSDPRVRREAERAVSRDLPIIPFRVTDAAPSPSMEYFISTTHWLDARGGSPLDHLDRLCEAVSRMLTGIGRTDAQYAPPAPAPKPAPPAEPARAQWTEAELAQFERLLVISMGPVARLLVRQSLPVARDKADLARLLARHIERPLERESFLLGCRSAGFITADAPAPAANAPAASAPPAPAEKERRGWGWNRRAAPREGATARNLEERPVDAAFVEGATLLLARHIGPVARVLAARNASAPSAGAMARAMAQAISSEHERAEFLHAIARL